jgi:hypothetical protein
MFLTEIFEAESTPVVVVYPGRFQPFHKGHRAVYDYLVGKYGRDSVYIATSNKVDPPRSPFNFSEKIEFIKLTGVPLDRVIETRDPYRVPELTQQLADNTKLIFAVSAKDMAEDPRFSKWTKKDGSPSYFQPMPKNTKDMAPIGQHGYIMTVPTFDFTVLGQPMRSATEVRQQFAQAKDEVKQAIIRDLFGAYSNEVFAIMKNRIQEDAAGVGVVASRSQRRDPRYKNSLTVDVQPGTPRKMMRALRLI